MIVLENELRRLIHGEFLRHLTWITMSMDLMSFS